MSMEGRQLDETIAGIFHTVMFHRSCGKFTYNNEESYSIRTLSYLDIDCDFVNFTYVCCESAALDRSLRQEIAEFSEQMRAAEHVSTPTHGSISLEFYQRKRARWPFQPECVPWEVWTVCCELGDPDDFNAHNHHEKVVETLQEKIVYVTELINKHEYVPKMPSRSDVDLIFDTSFPDIQPYLFKIHYSLAGCTSTNVGNTVRKLIRDTLAL